MNKWLIVGIASTVSLLSGAGAGYVVATKRLEKKYADLSSKEIAEAREFYKKQAEENPVFVNVTTSEDLDISEASDEDTNPSPKDQMIDASLEQAKVQYNKIYKAQVVDLGYHEETEEIDGEDPGDIPFDPSILPGGPDEIYVISRAEYFAEESGFSQCELKFCADGGVLDELDDYVKDHFTLIGNGIPPFGELSDDPNVVFLRNKKLEREFEVIKDDDRAVDILAAKLGERFPGGS